MTASRRLHSFCDDPNMEPKFRTVLNEAASTEVPGYGSWRQCSSEAEMLEAVVSEVSELVLARRVKVSVRETGASFEMTVSNRHLLSVSNMDLKAGSASPSQLISSFQKVFSGGRTLKFDIVDRRPPILRGVRSWPHESLKAALADVALTPSPTSRSSTLLDALKEQCFAWVHEGQFAETTNPEALRVLQQKALEREADSQTKFQLQKVEPRLVMTAVAPGIFLDVQMDGSSFLGLFPESARADVVAHWCHYLSVEVSGICTQDY